MQKLEIFWKAINAPRNAITQRIARFSVITDRRALCSQCPGLPLVINDGRESHHYQYQCNR